jgi:hypothetical protein
MKRLISFLLILSSVLSLCVVLSGSAVAHLPVYTWDNDAEVVDLSDFVASPGASLTEDFSLSGDHSVKIALDHGTTSYLKYDLTLVFPFQCRFFAYWPTDNWEGLDGLTQYLVSFAYSGVIYYMSNIYASWASYHDNNTILVSSAGPDGGSEPRVWLDKGAWHEFYFQLIDEHTYKLRIDGVSVYSGDAHSDSTIDVSYIYFMGLSNNGFTGHGYIYYDDFEVITDGDDNYYGNAAHFFNSGGPWWERTAQINIDGSSFVGIDFDITANANANQTWPESASEWNVSFPYIRLERDNGEESNSRFYIVISDHGINNIPSAEGQNATNNSVMLVFTATVDNWHVSFQYNYSPNGSHDLGVIDYEGTGAGPHDQVHFYNVSIAQVHRQLENNNMTWELVVCFRTWDQYYIDHRFNYTINEDPVPSMNRTTLKNYNQGGGYGWDYDVWVTLPGVYYWDIEGKWAPTYLSSPITHLYSNSYYSYNVILNETCLINIITGPLWMTVINNHSIGVNILLLSYSNLPLGYYPVVIESRSVAGTLNSVQSFVIHVIVVPNPDYPSFDFDFVNDLSLLWILLALIASVLIFSTFYQFRKGRY